jgi:hypothetical protein
MIEDDLRNTLDRVGHLREEPSQMKTPRYLGCIFVPSDGMALFMFEADDDDAVGELSWLAEVPFDRIIESVLFVPPHR